MSENLFEYEGEKQAKEEQQKTTESQNDSEAPNNGVDDEVLVDQPVKLAHEDLAATQAEVDDEETETRAGEDFEGQPSAKELSQQKKEEDEES